MDHWRRNGCQARVIPAYALLLSVVTACGGAPTQGGYEEPLVPPDAGDGWSVSSLLEQGIDPDPIGRLSHEIRFGAFDEINSMLIVRNGVLVFEGYYRNIQDWTSNHNLNSITKTVTSVLAGIAVGDGDIDGYDQKISDLLPEHADIFDQDPVKAAMILADVLTMRTGFAWGESDFAFNDPRHVGQQMYASTDPARFYLDRPLVARPGTRFHYDGGATQLLAEIVHEATGIPTVEYAESRLFAPLGITGYEWSMATNGRPKVDGGLRMSARNLAKIGQLFLQGGVWNGDQIVPGSWVAASVRDWTKSEDYEHYGFMWWLDPPPGVPGMTPRADDIYFGSGWGGQLLFVIPSYDMVVVFFGGPAQGYALSPDAYHVPCTVLTAILDAASDNGGGTR